MHGGRLCYQSGQRLEIPYLHLSYSVTFQAINSAPRVHYRGIPNTNPPLIRSWKGNLRKWIFALIEAGQNWPAAGWNFWHFKGGTLYKLINFGVLPEYKLVKFGVHFAGIEAGRQFPEIWLIFVTLTGGLVLGIPRYFPPQSMPMFSVVWFQSMSVSIPQLLQLLSLSGLLWENTGRVRVSGVPSLFCLGSFLTNSVRLFCLFCFANNYFYAWMYKTDS